MKINFFMSLVAFVLIPVNQPLAQTEDNPPIIDVSHQWEVTNIHGPSQVGISDTIAVDLNNDGWMDVVSASIEDGSIRAYINPANLARKNVEAVDLNFSQKIIEEDEVGLYRLISTDLNGDNRPDLVATSIESQKIFSYIQDIDGGFAKSTVAEKVLLPTDVGAGDFNGDGKMDLVSLSFENNEVYQHIQQIDGSFSTQVIAKEVLRPRKLTVADWNQDDFTDIAVASEEDSSVRVLFNKSNESWDEQLLTDAAIGTRNLTQCDLDQNGEQDLLVSHTGENALVVYYNYGAWPYQPTVIDDAAMGVNAVLCHDLNNDGQKDLAAIHAQHGNIYSYFQNQGFTSNLVANTRDGYITLDAADFSQTQQPQILTQAHFQQRNLLYNPQGQIAEQVVWQDFPDGAYHVATGDFNNDGMEDVVYAAFRENTVYWAENTMNGYTVHQIFKGIDGPQSVSVGDIDHDGDLDIVSAGAWDDTFWLHKNNGQGEFTTSILLSGANNAARSKIVDLNGDGHNDVILTSTQDDSVRWIDMSKNQPVAHLINNQMDGAFSFDILDYDHDGDTDIVVGNFFGNEVALLINDKATFTKTLLSSDKTKPLGIVAKDMNNDSFIDVVYSATMDGKVWLLKNNNEVFDEEVIFSYEFQIGAIVVNNLNHDAFMDVTTFFSRVGDVFYSSQTGLEFFISHFINYMRFTVTHIELISKCQSNGGTFIAAIKSSSVISTLEFKDVIFNNGFEIIKLGSPLESCFTILS